MRTIGNVLFVLTLIATPCSFANSTNSLVGTECMSLNKSQWQKFTQVQGNIHMDFFVQKDTNAPLLYYKSKIQEALYKIGKVYASQDLSHLLPKRISLYYYSELPHPYQSLAALFCPQLQSERGLNLFITKQLTQDYSVLFRKISHEIFHYITFRLGKNYPDWFEEGLADYTETLLYPRFTNDKARLHVYESPWVAISNPGELKTKSEILSFYGHAYLWIKYVAKGRPQFMKKVLNMNTQEPKEIFSSVLGASFQETFRAFQIAKYINLKNYRGSTNKENYKYWLFFSDRPTLLTPVNKISGSLSAFVWPLDKPLPFMNYYEELWIKRDVYFGSEVFEHKPSDLEGITRLIIRY